MERQSLHRIVLVDDSGLARLGLREQLNRTAEFRVVGEAASAAEGLESVARLAPDLVLLDLSLPDVSGVEVCRRMIAVRADTRVLMLSVHDAPALIHEALASGAQGYALKDTPVAMWRDAMRRMTGSRAVQPTQLFETVLQEVRDMANGVSSDSTRDLSPQERRLLPLIAEGRTNREIGAILALSEKTVKNYIYNMFPKLGITRRSQLVTLYARSLPSRSISTEDCA